jgi:hypothetical protein
MPITKITLSTAMRARDVSRPHEGHLTEAAGREDKATRPPEPPLPKPSPPASAPTFAPASAPTRAPQAGLPSTAGLPPMPAPPRRRRRRRS